MTPEQRLQELQLALPAAIAPRANYVTYRHVGGMLYLSGHGPRLADGSCRTGKLCSENDVASGYDDARLTALNLLATVKLAIGELSRVQAVVSVFGMVNAAPDFSLHPKVINGCSDLLVEVFGPEVGRHTRSAVGMCSLPSGMSVEIEMILAVL